jgi:hypothetical protein
MVAIVKEWNITPDDAELNRLSNNLKTAVIPDESRPVAR